ncbi:integrase [Mycobacterium sp. GA-1199]|uniref:tyrosine-type recombinase/integrase n=1 Tax=Mycobacterium sp. GA-1199 TaxID=1772287 RepID=UPI000747DF75|nr:tyrosine-type recombinase/integrase [Mycobacterium sp. GA-1199]KUI41816.1 integrase [Mycobacterium sp. GA-1199]
MAWEQFKHGSWHSRWTDPDGTERTKGGFKTRKAAKAHGTKAEEAKLHGRTFDPQRGKAKFRDVAAEWLESRRDLKETTRAGYREALASTTEAIAKRHARLNGLRIDEAFGGYPVNAITREQISQWVQRMKDAGKKPSTIRNAYFIVRQVLRHAVIDDRIPANPADYVKLPTDHNSGSQRVVDDPAQFLTPAQVAALVDATPWPYNVLVHVAAWTGLRAGELAGLQVGDVTLPAVATRPGSVRVERTVASVGKELVYLTPKTKGSRRTVPLTPQTTTLLRDYLAQHPRRNDSTAPLFPAFRLSTPPPSTSATKAAPEKVRAQRQAHALAALRVEEAERRLVLDWYAPLRHNTLAKAVFRPAVLRANRSKACIAPAFRWHGLRHSYISIAIAAGLPIFQISMFAGHAKPSTTENVYAHLLTDDHDEAMAALGAMAAETSDNVIRLHG